jgi:hypothetical protein
VAIAGLLVVAVGLAVGIANWRWSIYGLLCYLPVSGIAILAAYGDREPHAAAVLAKDFVFVIPAYVGFLVWAWRCRRPIFFPGAPVALFAALAGVVLVQAFNPALPNHLVGVIGIKVWLFYVPLFLLGYHLVRSREEVFRLFGLMSVLALVPALIGILEAALIYGGYDNAVYRMYGDAADAATQNRVQFEIAGGSLRRIPSTFSSFYQYYLFLASMIAVSYAWWRGAATTRVPGWLRAAVWLLLLTAVFVMGQRGAFVFVPLLVVLLVLLDRRPENRLSLRRAVPVALVVAAALALAAVLGVVSHTVETLEGEFGDVVVTSAREAVSETWVGLGAGIDSTGSRYAFGEDEAAPGVNGKFHEGWYVKAYLELGVLGLAIVLAFLGTIAVRGIQAHLQLERQKIGVISAAIVSLLIWTLIYNVKAQYMDFDPLNVYFWLLAGILVKLPSLESRPPRSHAA